MKYIPPQDELATVKLDKKFVVWLKVEAAKQQISMKELLQKQFPSTWKSGAIRK